MGASDRNEGPGRVGKKPGDFCLVSVAEKFESRLYFSVVSGCALQMLWFR